MRDDKGMHNDRREGSKRQHRHRRRWPLTWGTRSEEYIMISGGIEGRLVAKTAKPHFVTRSIFWSHRWMERRHNFYYYFTQRQRPLASSSFSWDNNFIFRPDRIGKKATHLRRYFPFLNYKKSVSFFNFTIWYFMQANRLRGMVLSRVVLPGAGRTLVRIKRFCS